MYDWYVYDAVRGDAVLSRASSVSGRGAAWTATGGSGIEPRQDSVAVKTKADRTIAQVVASNRAFLASLPTEIETEVD